VTETNGLSHLEKNSTVEKKEGKEGEFSYGRRGRGKGPSSTRKNGYLGLWFSAAKEKVRSCNRKGGMN